MADAAALIAPALFSLPPDLAAKLDAHCREQGEEPEDVIADAVALALDEAEGCIFGAAAIEAMLAGESPQ